MLYRVTSIKTGYDPIRSIAAEKPPLADDCERLVLETVRLQQVSRKITDTQVPDSIGKVSDSIGLLTIQEKVVLQYLQTNKVIKSGMVEQLLHIKEARARRLLKQMRERGLVVKVGKARNTYYVLGDAFKSGGGDE